ncbi:MAG: AAA family ATPase, partial [Myxococcota bacterium]
MLIGREPELAAVQEALRNSRLVSLVGLGGIGKTVVAETLARRVEDAYPGGVILVRFAGRDELITPILDALGEGAGELDVVEAAALALARRARVLLVLDEVEHLAHEAPLLLRLLEESEASILATSQVP